MIDGATIPCSIALRASHVCVYFHLRNYSPVRSLKLVIGDPATDGLILICISCTISPFPHKTLCAIKISLEAVCTLTHTPSPPHHAHSLPPLFLHTHTLPSSSTSSSSVQTVIMLVQIPDTSEVVEGKHIFKVFNISFNGSYHCYCDTASCWHLAMRCVGEGGRLGGGRGGGRGGRKRGTSFIACWML